MAHIYAHVPARGRDEVPSLPAASEQQVLKSWDQDIERAAARWAGGLAAVMDARDLAQEARLRLLVVTRAQPTVAVPYLRKVVKNASLAAALRYRARFDQDPLTEDLPAPMVEADDFYVIEAVSQWVDGLPRRLQAIYRALYREGRTQREAASILGVSQPRVAQLHRALLERGRRELAQFRA